MGLFGEKEKCAVCGRKISMLTKVKIVDGIICGDCRKKCSPLAKVGLQSVDQVIERIKAREVNAKKVAQFTPTDVVGNYIKVDRNSRTWRCPALDKEPDIFPFSTLIDFELVEDGVSITKGGLGSAVAGGVLFGGVGAIVDGGLGKKQKDVVHKMSIILNLRDEWIPRMEIALIKAETKKGGVVYKLNKDLAQQMLSLLTTITDIEESEDHNINQPTPSTEKSAADELLKFKQLLDMGAITQDEFDAKKKQLLGL